MKELFKLGLREAARGIAEGQFTSADYARSCLQRIWLMEEQVQAWQWLDHERAMELAEQADRRKNEGQATVPLQGLPLGIKDIFDTRVIPTEFGSPLFAGNMPKTSARVVEKLEAAGGFVMGKTVTAEFAFLHPGKTRNPWNPLHTPGGSSSGSAAAVAAGFVPAALGTQTNGSIIRPAAFCGVIGFKPSQGTISNHGTLDYSPTLDQSGVFTRSVADAAWVISCVAETQNPVSREIQALAKKPKLAAVRSPVWTRAEEAQRRIFADNVKKLREAGAEVVETELPAAFNQAHPCLRHIMAYEAARFFRELQARGREKISAGLNVFLDEGRTISDSAYQDALSFRRELQEDLSAFLKVFDAILTPPANGEAPATLDSTGDPAFCTIWTLCGVPAVTIPTRLGPQGLPLGLQMVGPFREDDKLLGVAQWCEEQLPFKSLVGRE
ncbi:MAG TPA: amidase [Burkholderiales bacterium]|nr:amidase [Burkholderiales bacterium]